MSSPAQALGSWVRTPLKAWMFVYVCSVCVVLCVQVGALHRVDPPQILTVCLYDSQFQN
jgi:hypothetical protein